MDVLITGAAQRLGAAMARHLAAKGHHVVVHYRTNRTAAQSLVQEIRAAGGEAASLAADLEDRQALRDLIGRASAVLGRPLDLLINNASSFVFDRVDDAPDTGFEAWDRNIKTNLEAPYFLTRAFAAQCEREGQVINMIDQRVKRLTPNYGSYTLAKAALATFTVTAAMALAPKIRVNAIAPGTTLQGAKQSHENFAHHRQISILERGGDVADILGALDYLLGAQNVTGQMIAPDGGQHLIWKLPES